MLNSSKEYRDKVNSLTGDFENALNEVDKLKDLLPTDKRKIIENATKTMKNAVKNVDYTDISKVKDLLKNL